MIGSKSVPTTQRNCDNFTKDVSIVDGENAIDSKVYGPRQRSVRRQEYKKWSPIGKINNSENLCKNISYSVEEMVNFFSYRSKVYKIFYLNSLNLFKFLEKP